MRVNQICSLVKWCEVVQILNYYYSFEEYFKAPCQSQVKLMKQCQEIKQNWAGRRNFGVYFCVIFHHYYQNFISGRKNGYWALLPPIRDFCNISRFPKIQSPKSLLIYSNRSFLRSKFGFSKSTKKNWITCILIILCLQKHGWFLRKPRLKFWFSQLTARFQFVFCIL